MHPRSGQRAAIARGLRAAAAVACLLLPGTVMAAGDPFEVCVLARNAPYAMRADASGFDVDTATAVAAILQRPFAPVWTDNDPRIQEIDDSDFPLRKLARGECDAIFSMPGPAGSTLAGHDDLALGEPYYGAAFELLACAADVPSRFRALRERKVAIQSQTVAHFALLMVGAEPVTYFSVPAAFDGLRQNEADAALLWGPTAGWHMRSTAPAGDGGGCAFVADYAPPRAVRWNLHVATRTAETELRTRIDQALASLTATGELAAASARYGIRFRPPFTGTYDLGALSELQRAQ